MKYNYKKRFGQYFLNDKNVLDTILKALDLDENDDVFEIGPGTGVVTVPLARLVRKVTTVEIDSQLCRVLKDGLKAVGISNVDIIHADFLKYDISNLSLPKKVVSNLPYYITTPILYKLIKSKFSKTTMVFTMQEEVARRILSKPGSKEYGILSILVQFYFDAEIVDLAPRTSFYPVPNVDSCVVKFVPKPSFDLNVDEKYLASTLERAFGNRRKMLRNTIPAEVLAEAGIDGARRPEALSVEEFCKLTEKLYKD